MRLFIVEITLLCLFLSPVNRARADEATAVLEKAIQAHGGAARLERTKRGHVKAEWTGKRLGRAFQWTWDETFDLPNRYRRKIEGTEGGMVCDMEEGFDGRKGWVRRERSIPQYVPGAKPDPLEGHWHAILALLLQLRNKDTELKLLGEATKDGRRLVGLRAVSPRAAADLYFDKTTGLLARAQMPLLVPGLGQDTIGENVYSDYREIDGVHYPMHWEGRAKNFYSSDVKIIFLEFIDKIEESVFAKPQAPLPQEPSAPPEDRFEERPNEEPPARWDVRFIVATLVVGSFMAMVWLIVRGSKRRKQEKSPHGEG